MRVKSKVWLEKRGELIFGSGRAAIFTYINQTGSIAKAAKRLNMSYRHAWSSVKSVEERLGKRLVICEKGGREGGGATLTDYAKRLLNKFSKLEAKTKLSTDKYYKEIFS